MTLDARHHWVELQSIRGIAALIVMLRHTTGVYGRGPEWWHSASLLLNSDAAVGMFFVLSGFVLTGPLQNKPFTVRSIISFWIRRTFRIYPALLLATTISLGLAIAYRSNTLHLGAWFDAYYTAERQNCAQIVLSFLGISAHLLPQVWTITLELCAAIILPFAVIIGMKSPPWFAVILAGSMASGMTIGPYTPYRCLLYLPYFLAGAGIVFVPQMIKGKIHHLRTSPSIVVALFILLMSARSFFTEDVPCAWLTLTELGCEVAIVALVVHGRVNLPVLRLQKLVWLGDISYSIYLLQYVTIFIVAFGFSVMEFYSGLMIGFIPRALVTALLAVVLVFPLAAFCHARVEVPGNEIGKSLARRVSGVQLSWFLLRKAKAS